MLREADGPFFFSGLHTIQRSEEDLMVKKRERNSFLTPLVVEVMPSGKRFKLYNDFIYLWKRKYIEIHIKRGFETDFASIPRIFRWLISKLGRYNKPAVVHDAIYQNVVPGHVFTRAEADLCFRDGMEDFKVAKWKRRLMYWAVRIGGFMAWRKR